MMIKGLGLLLAILAASNVFGINLTTSQSENSRPIIGPNWTTSFVEHYYQIQLLPYGLTEAMQILVNESWLGGVSNLIYDSHDRSNPNAIRVAAEKCRRLQDTWKEIVCAHKAGEKIGYANPNFDVEGLCRVLALAFRSVMDEIHNPNVFVGQIGIIARDSNGHIWGHNLDRLTVRSVTGMTYGYAVDDESMGGPIILYPLSLSAVQYERQHGRVLPRLADF